MKLTTGLAAAAFFNVASSINSGTAQVYLLRTQPESTQDAPLQLPRQLARQILFQRVGADYDSFVGHTPHGYDDKQALGLIKKFGNQPAQLFSNPPAKARRQLALIIEGVTEESLKVLQTTLPRSRKRHAFEIADPPSAKANEALFVADLGLSQVSRSGCDISAAWDTKRVECWRDGVFVEKYDLKTTPEVLELLNAGLPTLIQLAEEDEIETMMVLMPESSRASNIDLWTTSPRSAIHARSPQGESVMGGPSAGAAHSKSEETSPVPVAHPWVAAKGTIPSCFQSYNSCVTQTNNCTGGHGICTDKYAVRAAAARRADDEKPKSCFVCACRATLRRPETSGVPNQHIYWGGAACQKEDISVQFWLIAGFTITMIGAITFAVGMLFSVGEEKLPGVIGAGVSRSK